MNFESQIWHKVTCHHVYHAFLKSEVLHFPPDRIKPYREIIKNPDFDDGCQNTQRIHLLESRRRPLLEKIPNSTDWYLVKFLNEENVDKLHVIAHCGWDSICGSDKNELEKVAQREKPMLKVDPNDWDPPILWGHSISGPFTILEGNHRLVAWVAETPRRELKIPVFVGISPEKCFLHIFD